MDADLQHSPEKIPDLLAPLQRQEAEFTLGSRYIGGGGIRGRWTVFRRLNSLLATLLARPLVGHVRDPMSGFFALPQRVYRRGDDLSPIGYKVALELMARCRPRRIIEIPIDLRSASMGNPSSRLASSFAISPTSSASMLTSSRARGVHAGCLR